MSDHNLQVSPSIHEIGFLRLYQIIGRPAITHEEAEQNRRDAESAIASGEKPNKRPKRARNAIPSIIPISKSAWWAGVKNCKYPKPVKLSSRTTAWRAADIRALVQQLSGNGGVE